MTTASTAGNIDGLIDATNRNPCDPRGRFIRWHAARPESDWAAYRGAYHAAYRQVCDGLIAKARRSGGAA